MRSIAIVIALGFASGACERPPVPTSVARVEFARLGAAPVAIGQVSWQRSQPREAALPPAAPAGESMRTPLFEDQLTVATSAVASAALPWIEGFFEEATGTDLQLRVTSDRSAVRWVLDGQVAAALIAGAPTERERDQGAVAHPVGDVALAVVTHPGVQFANIDLPYLKQLLTGTINHWSWVGSDAGHVALVLPRAGEMAGFVARAFMPGDALTDRSIRYADETEGLLQVRQTPGAIGVFRLEATRDIDGIKVLHVDGREPGAIHVRSGHYPFGATLHVVTKGEPGAAVAGLIRTLTHP